jgi:hypothetical protein
MFFMASPLSDSGDLHPNSSTKTAAPEKSKASKELKHLTIITLFEACARRRCAAPE